MTNSLNSAERSALQTAKIEKIVNTNILVEWKLKVREILA